MQRNDNVNHIGYPSESSEIELLIANSLGNIKALQIEKEKLENQVRIEDAQFKDTNNQFATLCNSIADVLNQKLLTLNNLITDSVNSNYDDANEPIDDVLNYDIELLKSERELLYLEINSLESYYQAQTQQADVEVLKCGRFIQEQWADQLFNLSYQINAQREEIFKMQGELAKVDEKINLNKKIAVQCQLFLLQEKANVQRTQDVSNILNNNNTNYQPTPIGQVPDNTLYLKEALQYCGFNDDQIDEIRLPKPHKPRFVRSDFCEILQWALGHYTHEQITNLLKEPNGIKNLVALYNHYPTLKKLNFSNDELYNIAIRSEAEAYFKCASEHGPKLISLDLSATNLFNLIRQADTIKVDLSSLDELFEHLPLLIENFTLKELEQFIMTNSGLHDLMAIDRRYKALNQYGFKNHQIIDLLSIHVHHRYHVLDAVFDYFPALKKMNFEPKDIVEIVNKKKGTSAHKKLSRITQFYPFLEPFNFKPAHIVAMFSINIGSVFFEPLIEYINKLSDDEKKSLPVGYIVSEIACCDSIGKIVFLLNDLLQSSRNETNKRGIEDTVSTVASNVKNQSPPRKRNKTTEREETSSPPLVEITASMFYQTSSKNDKTDNNNNNNNDKGYSN